MITLLSRTFLHQVLTAAVLAAASAAPALPSSGTADNNGSLRLAALFTDHMVLQRDALCPVWGWAAPGQTVTVSLSGAETTGTSTTAALAGPDGKWTARIGPFAAGGPCSLTVATDAQSVTLRDVLIGEVWICSGQSNMDWPVRLSRDPEATIASSSDTLLRLFSVPHRSVPLPLPDIPDAAPWKLCGPETVGGFSAVAYFFGKDLRERLNVPVGLIKTAAGGTPAESWTSREGLGPFVEFHHGIAALNAEPLEPEKAQARYQERLAAWNRMRDEADPGFDAKASAEKSGGASPWKWAGPDVDTSGWNRIQIPGKWEDQGYPTFDGTVWLRREIELPAEALGSGGLVLHLGPVDDSEETWFNGHRLGTEPGRGARTYEIAADQARPGRNVLSIRVFDFGGAGGFNGKPEDFYLETTGTENARRFPLAGEWKFHTGADLSKLPPAPRPPGNWSRPTGLFNGMVAPLIPYAMRGVIWYQGESNAPRAWQYRTLFPAMIEDWRRLWQQGDFPFLYVQLANFLARKPEPDEDTWAELRDAQLATLRVPNTAMASAVDIGEAGDIHPRNKQDVGRRLSRAARALAYGEDVEWSGPLYSGMSVEGNAIRVRFTHTKGGLTAPGGELKGFAIAGKDRKFVWADARIEGDTVVVSSPQVEDPVAVRYGWAINPEITLYNGEGLPASPFRTDDWPALSRDAR